MPALNKVASRAGVKQVLKFIPFAEWSTNAAIGFSAMIYEAIAMLATATMFSQLCLPSKLERLPDEKRVMSRLDHKFIAAITLMARESHCTYVVERNLL